MRGRRRAMAEEKPWWCPRCQRWWGWAIKSEKRGGYICHTCGEFVTSEPPPYEEFYCEGCDD